GVKRDVGGLDGEGCALLRLAAAVHPSRMDGVLLVQPTATAVGYDGSGDYFLDVRGSPQRRRDGEVAPFRFAGIQLLHWRLFDETPSGAFSLVRLFDRAEAAGRPPAAVQD